MFPSFIYIYIYIKFWFEILTGMSQISSTDPKPLHGRSSAEAYPNAKLSALLSVHSHTDHTSAAQVAAAAVGEASPVELHGRRSVKAWTFDPYSSQNLHQKLSSWSVIQWWKRTGLNSPAKKTRSATSLKKSYLSRTSSSKGQLWGSRTHPRRIRRRPRSAG